MVVQKTRRWIVKHRYKDDNIHKKCGLEILRKAEQSRKQSKLYNRSPFIHKFSAISSIKKEQLSNFILIQSLQENKSYIFYWSQVNHFFSTEANLPA